MATLTVKPRNKKELEQVTAYLKRYNIPVSVKDKKAAAKKKAKEKFLDSLEGRLNEVKLHMEGKIKLKDARGLLNEL
jgi:hypothetical protein